MSCDKVFFRGKEFYKEDFKAILADSIRKNFELQKEAYLDSLEKHDVQGVKYKLNPYTEKLVSFRDGVVIIKSYIPTREFWEYFENQEGYKELFNSGYTAKSIGDIIYDNTKMNEFLALHEFNKDVYKGQKTDLEILIGTLEQLTEKAPSDSNSTFPVSKEIYSKLGNKTTTGNVVINPVYQNEGVEYANSINGVFSLRVNDTNQHFGNPFTSNPSLAEKDGLTLVNDTQEAVERYIDWVLNSNDERANWIRQVLKTGVLKNRPIVYYKELGEPSHATALDYLINQYNWESQKDTVPTSMSEIVNHSGGAKGYDAIWHLEGESFGMVNNNHYLLPEDGPVEDNSLKLKGVKPVDATIYVGKVNKTGKAEGQGQKQVSLAEKLMGRIEDNQTTRNTKKIRNYAQVVNADSIFAIGSLIPKDGEIKLSRGKVSKTALIPQVDGGTSIGVQLGIMQDKSVYVFNQEANDVYPIGWYKWDNESKDFIPTETPTLTKNFAGIGTSSKVTPQGVQAIRDVYQKTANSFISEDQTPTPPITPTPNKVITYEDLNENQKKAYQEVLDFLLSEEGPMVHSLIGYAGTGKTTTLRAIMDAFNKSYEYTTAKPKVYYSTPTHKANNVLNESVGNRVQVRTLHSLLGFNSTVNLDRVNQIEIKYKKKNKGLLSKSDIPNVLIVDEASMISDELYDVLMDTAEKTNTKILFVGDSAQLPPVNKTKEVKLSKTLTDTPTKSVLTKVMRANNPHLLQESMEVRNTGSFSYETKLIGEDKGVVFTTNYNAFINEIIEQFKHPAFENNPKLFRIITHTNKSVEEYNRAIREGLYGKNAEPYVVGDILMGYDNIIQGNGRVITNSQDYKVISTEKTTEVIDGIELPGYRVFIESLDNTYYNQVFIIDKNLSQELKDKLRETYSFYAVQAQLSKAGKAQFDIFKNSLILPFDIVDPNTGKVVINKSIDYGYAHTIHKSQGSTYENIYVDDIGISQTNFDMAQKLRYVGVTRAKNKATILYDPYKKARSFADMSDGYLKSDLNENDFFKKFNEDSRQILNKGGYLIFNTAEVRQEDPRQMRMIKELIKFYGKENLKAEKISNHKVAVYLEEFQGVPETSRPYLVSSLDEIKAKERFLKNDVIKILEQGPLKDLIPTKNTKNPEVKAYVGNNGIFFSVVTSKDFGKAEIEKSLFDAGILQGQDYIFDFEDTTLIHGSKYNGYSKEISMTFSNEYLSKVAQVERLRKIQAFVNSTKNKSLMANFKDNPDLFLDEQNNLTEEGLNILETHYEKTNKVSTNNQTSLNFDEEIPPLNSPNRNRPVTDNFEEYKRHKQTLLDEVNQNIRQLNRDIKNPKRTPLNKIGEVRDTITKLKLYASKIESEIQTLEQKSEKEMFHALFDELDALKDLIFNPDAKIGEIKTRIEFLNEFITGKQFNSVHNSHFKNLQGSTNPDYPLLLKELQNLNVHYFKRLKDITTNVLEKEISYYNNVVKNDSLTDKEVEELLEARSDISAMEKAFLSVTNSSRNDTILPQVLKSVVEASVVRENSTSTSYKNRLLELANAITSGNFKFIFETNKQGVLTGNIIDLFTPAYRKTLSEFYNIDKDNTKTIHEKQKEKLKWLKNNSEVIDVRKLSVVKQLYGHAYSQHFKFSDSEMSAYEQELKNTLGPLYDEYLEKVLQQLEIYEQTKTNLNTLNLTADEKNRELLKNDLFAFLEHYHSRNYTKTQKYSMSTGGQGHIYFNLNDLVMIPLKEKVVAIDIFNNDVVSDTGFYNQTFIKEVLGDPDKLEYWKLMKEAYTQYINPTYEVSEMSFAKFHKDVLEVVADEKNVLYKSKGLVGGAIKAYRDFFFEQGTNTPNRHGVVANYSDNTKREIYELAETFKSKTLEELKQMSDELGITYDNLTKQEIARNVASQIIYSQYSLDINKVTGALLDLAALQRAKQNSLPTAEIILENFKSIKDENGNDRKNAIERMEYYIERVIKNNGNYSRGTDSLLGKNLSENAWYQFFLNGASKIPFIKQTISAKKGYSLTDSEKALYKALADAKKTGVKTDESYKITVDNVVYQKIYDENTGTSTYSQVQEDGTLSPITAETFEDKYQKHLQKRMDDLGLDINGAGILQGILKTIVLRALGFNIPGGIFNRIEGKNSGLVMDQTGYYWTPGNINDADSFMSFANILEMLPEKLSPKDLKKYKELAKCRKLFDIMKVIQDRKNVLDRNSGSFINNLPNQIFKWAVDNPEFKSQGAIALAILMDTKIKDIHGKEHQVFNGHEFAMWDLKGETLVLKPEFRTPENISNWENFDIDEHNLENNQYFLQRNKIKQAIARSQGDYDDLNTQMITKRSYGQILMLFKKWMPEHFMQRFSKGEGFDLVAGKKKQKGRYRYLADHPPILIASGLATMGISLGFGPLGMMIGAGISGVIAVHALKNVFNQKASKSTLENIQELSSFLKTLAIQSLNYPLQLVNIRKGINVERDGFKNTNLTQEEIGAFRAVAKEIAVKLNWVLIKLAVMGLLWNDDDDESVERQFANFADNQITKIIHTSEQFYNPKSLFEDFSRMALIRWCNDVHKLTEAIINFENEDIKKYMLRTSPLPKLLTNNGFGFLDEREYQSADWGDTFIKDYKTNGEYSAKKEYLELLGKIKSKYKEQGYQETEINDFIKAKDPEETYKEALARIKSYDI